MSLRRGTCARALLLALSLAAATARQDAAILYLADGDERRLADLAASIARLDAHFNGVYKYPVVIFHDVGGAPGRRGGGEGWARGRGGVGGGRGGAEGGGRGAARGARVVPARGGAGVVHSQ